MLSKGTCTYAYTCTHIFARAKHEIFFKFSWSFLYGVYANCLALAILTLEVSHDRSSILQR